MILSIVVPTLDPTVYLPRLLESLRGIESDDVEFILVNQSGKSFPCNDILPSLQTKELLCDRIPAAQARNYGASQAEGTYLFFLDDDAYIYHSIDALIKILEELRCHNAPELIIADCGKVVDNNYLSYWKKDWKYLDYKNFFGTVIEWNIIVKKKLFVEVNGFPDVGAGCNHRAQSGEAFILMSMILNKHIRAITRKDIKIAHPDLLSPKPIRTVLGYFYGDGYAMGVGIKYLTLMQKMYWLVRAVARIGYCLIKPKRRLPIILGYDLSHQYRHKMCFYMLLGFLTGLVCSKPHENIYD